MKKTNSVPAAASPQRVIPFRLRPPGLEILAIVFLAGCATQRPVALVESGSPNTTVPIRLELGPVGLISPTTPAAFDFDQAKGRIESAADAAGQAAAQVLAGSPSGDPAVDMAAGAVGFALAPVAAAASALRTTHEKLPPNKLSEVEQALTQEMAEAADQQRFRDYLLRAAAEKIPGRLVLIGSPGQSSPNLPPLSAILEVRTEELRLERTGSGDGSFALHIKTRVRFLNSAEGALLYEQPFDFRSGTDFFIDWTRRDALRSVADTGYRELAQHILNQFFSTSSEGPVLVGAGYKKHPAPSSDSQVQMAAHHYQAGSRPAIQFVNHLAFDSASPAQDRPPLATVPRFVGDGVAASGSLGIYSTASVAQATIQRPLTKDEAVAEAISDVEWSLDGLDNSPNSVVMLMACAAAIPMSLWKQGVSAVRGLSSRQYQAAEEKLTAAARQTQPHRELAYQVTQQLTPKTAQPVMLVRQPLPANAENEPALMRCMANGTLAWLPQGETAASYLVDRGAETALEIHVLSAALTGKNGVNPPLALSVEAKATLLRTRDGQELYSCPVSYRSVERKFTEWAAQDAQPFRQELIQCYRQMGSAIVDQLISRQFVAPDKAPYPTLAENSDQPR